MHDEQLKEPTVASETIFQGKVITMQVDTVKLPNGDQATREIVRHPGAVAVLAVTDEERVVLVRQYRKPCDRVLLEIPAGKLEPGEERLACAKRELLEETGYKAKEWIHLHSMFTSPGFADEYIHLYAAKELTPGDQQLDNDEFLNVLEVAPEEVEQLMERQEVADAKTLTALYWWMWQRMKAGRE